MVNAIINVLLNFTDTTKILNAMSVLLHALAVKTNTIVSLAFKASDIISLVSVYKLALIDISRHFLMAY
jgi:hypothetical protein